MTNDEQLREVEGKELAATAVATKPSQALVAELRICPGGRIIKREDGHTHESAPG